METEARPASLRTCVGCRVRSPRSDLLRVVAVEGDLVPDPARRLGGRGAHLHPDPDCLALAERRRAWPRALRAVGPLDATAVSAFLVSASISITQHDPARRSATQSRVAARPEAGRPDPMSSR